MTTGNPRDSDVASAPAGNKLGIASQDIERTAANGTQSADSDIDVFQTFTSDPERVLMNFSGGIVYPFSSA
ncbi:hypothetical protein D777_02239 [Marinobacter nitratireducens]|uniref:Uncharacterized protein n=1 Tax=Marinobacter nitratireducens TaxID=1137280 RepID=A0A072N0Q4_9GAMM|nr:hypothetical protein D777_02239 [Marinobacter nitratireducens]